MNLLNTVTEINLNEVDTNINVMNDVLEELQIELENGEITQEEFDECEAATARDLEYEKAIHAVVSRRLHGRA